MPQARATLRTLTIGASLVLCSSQARAQVPERFTNLQVLPKEMPRRDLVTTMRHWASALGVRCGHCHTGGNPDTLQGVDFASDEKWEKRTARAMFRMMKGVEADYLRQLEARPVSATVPAEPALGLACATCHRGLRRPETLDAVLSRILESEGLDAALRSYEDLRGKYLGRGSYDFSERPLNTIAERLLAEKRSQEATRLLELGARFNPDAAWLHHLLGDARLAEGDRPGALAAYERALVIEPE
ncbi:MAG TPA: c-type cytochrome, partial [Vicinamibacteria bacterium]